MLARLTLALAFLAANVVAQQAIYGQCGGQGWNGPTSCQAGTECKYQNDYYSQCLSENDHPDWLGEEDGGDDGSGDDGSGADDGSDDGSGEGDDQGGETTEG
ncbi:hypothetical protein QBC47DRAFT_365801 [Echria macrotheca]|uniref:CBM1 domain-containing protein n=1 Tax=Echria macrotheca TaxID=438768 RepID=A0AAJ0B126_9PEZI|nr:hypothetical protein QBC47DRAFT_365801 [Echria macrotheca]